MLKCRLCLKHSKNASSIFDNNDGISFADMVTLIANVKISKEDGITDQICYSCRRKTKEVYDFKLMVERSNEALQENGCMKRVHFSNIHDIKSFIEIPENDFKEPTTVIVTEILVNSSEEPFHYNDVIIKKVSLNEIKPLSLIDFLNSIKEEAESNDIDDPDDYVSYEVDVDYDPDLKKDPNWPVQPKPNKKLKKKTNENETVLTTPIKPVYLADYIIVHEKKQAQRQKKIKNLHICPYCGKMTKSLKIHLLVHEDVKPFKCDICSTKFPSNNRLKDHIKNIHAPRTVKCDQCSASFKSKSALKSHMKSHTDERKYICQICSKAFKTVNHLNRHVHLCHNLVSKTVKCELCTDTFSSKFNLNHHMRVHTGERPYKCEMCSQPYSYKHDFNRHCLKKHGVCFKQRSVNVMNEEVLAQERILMRDLVLRMNGVLKDGKPVNPFEGPRGALAFGQLVKAIQAGKVVVDLNCES